jgi:hypothetical protein
MDNHGLLTKLRTLEARVTAIDMADGSPKDLSERLSLIRKDQIDFGKRLSSIEEVLMAYGAIEGSSEPVQDPTIREEIPSDGEKSLDAGAPLPDDDRSLMADLADDLSLNVADGDGKP